MRGVFRGTRKKPEKTSLLYNIRVFVAPDVFRPFVAQSTRRRAADRINMITRSPDRLDGGRATAKLAFD